MNTLLLNRDGFVMPADGWYQVAPLGEFAHAGAGVVQVVDVEACAAMVNRFAEEAVTDNFAGLLVDFDHFSLDGEKRSEAAGWITALENRDGGLFAQIRWSDLGEEAVRGGRYRFLSPVWSRSDCQDLGGGRVRPVRLLNAAVTNDPNLKGMRPLSNSAAGAALATVNGDQSTVNSAAGTAADANVQQSTSNVQHPTGVVANAGGPGRFKWVLSGDGKHCPSCAAVAGQVHTMAEWDAAGIRPGGGALYCLGKCKCRLVATEGASSGAVTGVVKRHRPVGNRSGGGETGLTVGQSVSAAVREAKWVARAGMMANQGWTDEARAASLAVRRAKADARQSTTDAKTDKVSDSVKGCYKQLLADMDAANGDPEKLMEASERYLASRSRDKTDFTLADIEAVRECLKRDKTLTDYQLRLAEDALTEASAWLRGDARGLLDVAEKEIVGDLQAAGLRLTAVEALRRYLNPLRYYAESLLSG